VLDENPHASPEAPSRLWLAHRGSRPVGLLLGVPFRAHARGLELRGHWGVDLYVPEAYRGQGIGAALLTRWRDESPLALGLGITDSAFRIELSLGWHAVPLPPRLVCPLTARGALALRLPPGRVVPAPRAATPARAVELRQAPAPDPRIDALWRQLRDLYPAHIDRDRSFLDWRYGCSPETGWQWWWLERAGRLDGAAGVRIERTRLRTKAWLYELLIDPEDEAGGRALIGGMMAALREQRVDVVEGRITVPWLGAWLEREGFFPGRGSDRFIVHAGAELAGEDLHTGGWYLTLGDSGNP
jgi:GNAT superfamily N-acetyltransferase